MRVYATEKLPVYQVIGPRLRIHWDYDFEPREGMYGEDESQWSFQEAVVPVDADKEAFIAAVTALNGPAEELEEGRFNE